MFHVLATEGGYQDFSIGGAEWFWLAFSGLTALLAIGVGFYLMRGVLAPDQVRASLRNAFGWETTAHGLPFQRGKSNDTLQFPSLDIAVSVPDRLDARHSEGRRKL